MNPYLFPAQACSLQERGHPTVAGNPSLALQAEPAEKSLRLRVLPQFARVAALRAPPAVLAPGTRLLAATWARNMRDLPRSSVSHLSNLLKVRPSHLRQHY